MITVRDLYTLDIFALRRVNAATALGRQSVHSVGYADAVERKIYADRQYNRFLRRLKNKIERA